MKILFAASECVPFIKTGGLADVVGALAPVLAKKGHDVRVMLPKYGAIPEKYRYAMNHVCDFYIQLGWRTQFCGIDELRQDGVTFYFIDNEYYFNRNYIYGMGGDEYERFGFFCRAVLEALPRLGFHPDILHTHDWQSGMIPALMRIQYSWDRFFDNVHTVFTIHNLQYQGVFGIDAIQPEDASANIKRRRRDLLPDVGHNERAARAILRGRGIDVLCAALHFGRRAKLRKFVPRAERLVARSGAMPREREESAIDARRASVVVHCLVD